MEQDKSMQNIKVIAFRLKDEEYGVDVNQVKSIERLQEVTRVPQTLDFVKGVINLRGEVTSVIHLASRFGLAETEATENSRVIIVNLGTLQAGLIVDAANDVIDIPSSAIEPPPEAIGGVKAGFIQGVAKLDDRLLILVNLNKILGEDEIEQLEEMHADDNGKE